MTYVVEHPVVMELYAQKFEKYNVLIPTTFKHLITQPEENATGYRA